MANRNFTIGNHGESEYDPDAGGPVTVISQIGPVTYNAKITTSKYSPVTEEFENKEYILTPGVTKAIDVDSAMTVKLICSTIPPNTFTKCVNGWDKNIPIQSTEISYTLTSSEFLGSDLGDAKGRQFVVSTRGAEAYKVTVGDTISYDPISGFDVVSQTGAVTYSATVRVQVYDAVGEEYFNFDTPVALGVPTEINFTPRPGATYAYLICETIAGKRFSGASNGTIEIAYDKYAINYRLTDGELPPNPDSSRQYLIQTVDDTPIPTPEPTITNNYRLTRPELKEFQKQVYASQVPDDPRKPAWEFVSNVFLVPFVVPASEIDKREDIKARDITFNIADRLKGNSIALDLGTIEIPGRYGNSLDYYNASVSLYMPFKSGEIDLDPFQVIGGSIRLEYQVNPSDGNTTLNIYNEGDELIQTSTFKMGSEYPFYSFYDIQDKFYSPENVVNLIRSAYVTVKIPDYSGVAVPKVTVSGNLEGVTGRVDFSEVSIDNIPYADEYDELISKLKAGIVIK